jgi:hypothetical protein
MLLLPVVWAYALQFRGADERRLAEATAILEADRDPRATECDLAPPPHLHYDDPSYATPGHPCRCGLYQTDAPSRAECLAQRDQLHALAEWRRQRGLWWDECWRIATLAQLSPSQEDLALCTTAGYAVGGAGARTSLGLDARPTKTALWGARYARRLARLAGRQP